MHEKFLVRNSYCDLCILKYFGLRTATVGTLRTCMRERKRGKALLLLFLSLLLFFLCVEMQLMH